MRAFLETLRNLGPSRLALIGIVGAVLLGGFAYLGMRLSGPDYGLLYSGLDLKDNAAVVAKLEQGNVPYQVSSDGGSIRVPVDQVGRLRLSMAEIGVPHGGSVGYELFDKPDSLGTTNFQQGINEIRALEGELARTIDSLSVVEEARVHLVLPKRELFARDKQDPSASIVIKTRGPNALGKQQIAGILNLVAGAVPGLKTSRISIIDQGGNLLARGNEDGGDGFNATSTAEEQRAAYETQLSRNVEDMLERTLGYGHVRVDVSADMDFDKLTTSQESYDPDGQVVRSTQSSNDTNESGQPADQPVTVQTNLPEGQQTQNNNNAATRSKESKNEETTNYEISKKTTSQTRETGVVKRISVAVLVDGTYGGAEHAYQPRTKEELDSLTALVQSAIGYDEKRGDTVKVVNLRFAEAPEAESATGILSWFDNYDVRRIIEAVGATLVAVLFILFAVRPTVNRVLLGSPATAGAGGHAMLPGMAMQGALPAPGGAMAAIGGMSGGGMALPVGSLSALATTTGPDGSIIPVIEEEESMINISQVEGRVRLSSMRKIGEIVDKHPDEAVAILRNWMYQTS